jgi:hypothetical protein
MTGGDSRKSSVHENRLKKRHRLAKKVGITRSGGPQSFALSFQLALFLGLFPSATKPDAAPMSVSAMLITASVAAGIAIWMPGGLNGHGEPGFA